MKRRTSPQTLHIEFLPTQSFKPTAEKVQADAFKLLQKNLSLKQRLHARRVSEDVPTTTSTGRKIDRGGKFFKVIEGCNEMLLQHL